ncbi:MAG: mobile mystery protein A [Bdellovibrionia bacterium]
MKVAKKTTINQLKAMENKLKPLKQLGELPRPRSGWLKAIRGAMGMTTRQLGSRLGTTHQTIMRQEEREILGAVTLDSLDRAARAMKCRLVYAIVPESQYGSLEAILDERAHALARRLAKGVDHSMKLENQGVDRVETEDQIESLAQELKSKLDPRLWEK